MLLYYLIDVKKSQPKIIDLYFAKHPENTKEELIVKNGKKKTDTETIVYSSIPLTEIYGLHQLCNDTNEKKIYFFHLGNYEFFYSIGKNLNNAIYNLNQNINHEKWSIIQKIVDLKQYDSRSLDQINWNDSRHKMPSCLI